MLQLRPICENCGKTLPNESGEAMICTFECTFCADCVENVFEKCLPELWRRFWKTTYPPYALSNPWLPGELSGSNWKKIQACWFTKIQKVIWSLRKHLSKK